MKFYYFFFNRTALSLAIKEKNEEIIKLLLSNQRVNPNIKLVIIKYFFNLIFYFISFTKLNRKYFNYIQYFYFHHI